jgi:hypothetical protein
LVTPARRASSRWVSPACSRTAFSRAPTPKAVAWFSVLLALRGRLAPAVFRVVFAFFVARTLACHSMIVQSVRYLTRAIPPQKSLPDCASREGEMIPLAVKTDHVVD